MENIFDQSQHLGLMTVPGGSQNQNSGATFDNLQCDKIREALYRKKVQGDSYILLFLYNGFKENQKTMVNELFEKYGAQINNRSGESIPFFTVYSEEVFENLKSKTTPRIRALLNDRFDFKLDKRTQFQKMNWLAQSYRLDNQLPALVVINANENTSEELFYSISFHYFKSAQRVYEKLMNVFDLIEQNPNSLEFIKTELEGGYSRIVDAVFDFEPIETKVQRFWKKIQEKHPFTIQELAKDLGWSRNSLSNYITGEQCIKVDRAFQIAKHFHFSLEEMEELWKYTDATPKEREQWALGTNSEFEDIKKIFN